MARLRFLWTLFVCLFVIPSSSAEVLVDTENSEDIPTIEIIRNEDGEEGLRRDVGSDQAQPFEEPAENEPPLQTQVDTPSSDAQTQDLQDDPQCPNPTPVNGTMRVVKGHPFSYGCNVLLTCDPGLKFPDGMSVWNLTCLAVPHPNIVIWVPVKNMRFICSAHQDTAIDILDTNNSQADVTDTKINDGNNNGYKAVAENNKEKRSVTAEMEDEPVEEFPRDSEAEITFTEDAVTNPTEEEEKDILEENEDSVQSEKQDEIKEEDSKMEEDSFPSETEEEDNSFENEGEEEEGEIGEYETFETGSEPHANEENKERQNVEEEVVKEGEDSEEFPEEEQENELGINMSSENEEYVEPQEETEEEEEQSKEEVRGEKEVEEIDRGEENAVEEEEIEEEVSDEENETNEEEEEEESLAPVEQDLENEDEEEELFVKNPDEYEKTDEQLETMISVDSFIEQLGIPPYLDEKTVKEPWHTETDFEVSDVRVEGMHPYCSMPPISGPCKALSHRYYFDTNTGECHRFIFGGCRGNGNNFKSMEECIDLCWRQP